MKLYHGTTTKHLPSILATGVHPRSTTGNSNWDHSVISQEDSVYLTNAYALHFAGAALQENGDDQLVVLEIDTKFLDEECLVADEDAVEQSFRGNDSLPKSWTMKQRNEYYRDRIHEYSWEASLKVIGNCAYVGVVPTCAITRVALVTVHMHAQLIMRGYDPSISLINYRLIGQKYREAMTWLFNPHQVSEPTTELERVMSINFPSDRTEIEVLSYNEAVQRFANEFHPDL